MSSSSDLIFSLGKALRFSQHIIAFGCIYFQKACAQKRHEDADLVAMVCLFVAAKAGEAPRRMLDFMNAYFLQRPKCITAQKLDLDMNASKDRSQAGVMDRDSAAYLEFKDEIIALEAEILVASEFTFFYDVPYPFVNAAVSRIMDDPRFSFEAFPHRRLSEIPREYLPEEQTTLTVDEETLVGAITAEAAVDSESAVDNSTKIITDTRVTTENVTVVSLSASSPAIKAKCQHCAKVAAAGIVLQPLSLVHNKIAYLATSFVNTFLRTSVCIHKSPQIIALSAIFAAYSTFGYQIRFTGTNFIDGKPPVTSSASTATLSNSLSSPSSPLTPITPNGKSNHVDAPKECDTFFWFQQFCPALDYTLLKGLVLQLAQAEHRSGVKSALDEGLNHLWFQLKHDPYYKATPAPTSSSSVATSKTKYTKQEVNANLFPTEKTKQEHKYESKRRSGSGSRVNDKHSSKERRSKERHDKDNKSRRSSGSERDKEHRKRAPISGQKDYIKEEKERGNKDKDRRRSGSGEKKVRRRSGSRDRDKKRHEDRDKKDAGHDRWKPDEKRAGRSSSPARKKQKN